MTQDIQKLFKGLNNAEPPQGIEGKILAAIALEKSLVIRKKLMLVRGVMMIFSGVFVYFLLTFGKVFLASDFWNLAKLITSDTSIIAEHVGDFSVSLLETLPVLEISAILVPVFGILIVLSYYFKFDSNNQLKSAN